MQAERVRRAPLRAVDLAAVAVGGVAGSLARYAVTLLLPHAPGTFAWSTVVENVSGSALIGVLMALIASRPALGKWRPLLGVGLLGGYTTFSGYTLDAHALLLAGRPGVAVLYLLLTLAGALGGVFAGWRLTQLLLERRSRP